MQQVPSSTDNRDYKLHKIPNMLSCFVGECELGGPIMLTYAFHQFGKKNSLGEKKKQIRLTNPCFTWLLHLGEALGLYDVPCFNWKYHCTVMQLNCFPTLFNSSSYMYCVCNEDTMIHIFSLFLDYICSRQLEDENLYSHRVCLQF